MNYLNADAIVRIETVDRQSTIFTIEDKRVFDRKTFRIKKIKTVRQLGTDEYEPLEYFLERNPKYTCENNAILRKNWLINIYTSDGKVFSLNCDTEETRNLILKGLKYKQQEFILNSELLTILYKKEQADDGTSEGN